MIPYKLLSLADIYADYQNYFKNDKPSFLSLLENHINLDEIIPLFYRSHFYASTGKQRKFPLNAMLWNLIIQHIISFSTAQYFLHTPNHLMNSVVFTKVPNYSNFE